MLPASLRGIHAGGAFLSHSATSTYCHPEAPVPRPVREAGSLGTDFATAFDTLTVDYTSCTVTGENVP